MYNKISLCSSSLLTCYIHFLFMPTLLLRTYHGSGILHFNTRSPFLLKIHIIFYSQYAEFRNATYEKVQLDLLQSFLKIKLNDHSQFSTKIVNKFSSSPFYTFSYLNKTSIEKKP